MCPSQTCCTRTVDDFEDRSGLPCRVHPVDGHARHACAPRVQVELLRIVSEALTNVRKHADATMVRIAAEVSDGRAARSASPTTDAASSYDEALDQGLGLRGMHERARLIGGSLLVRSELSGGSTVEVRTPLVAPGVDRRVGDE